MLVLQDTVFFSYGTHPKTKGLGPIGKSNGAGERGLIMHNALAFTAAGVPLGLLSQNVWARQEVPEEGYQEKIERLQCTAIEEKESAKWLLALRETIERAPRRVSKSSRWPTGNRTSSSSSPRPENSSARSF